MLFLSYSKRTPYLRWGSQQGKLQSCFRETQLKLSVVLKQKLVTLSNSLYLQNMASVTRMTQFWNYAAGLFYIYTLWKLDKNHVFICTSLFLVLNSDWINWPFHGFWGHLVWGQTRETLQEMHGKSRDFDADWFEEDWHSAISLNYKVKILSSSSVGSHISFKLESQTTSCNIARGIT